MPWNEADRLKYDVIRARYTSDMCGGGVRLDRAAPADAQGARAEAYRSTNYSECAVLYDPLRLSVAIFGQGVSAVHDCSEQVLRLAR